MKYSIFTPSYNRGNLLPRVYQSLLRQQEQDFEWIIVDDGSVDQTQEIVDAMLSESKLNIRYLKKENGGKHTAHNLALSEARGEWFMCLDSDDILADDALIKLNHAILMTQTSDCGIIGNKTTRDGRSLSGEISEGSIHRGMYGYQKHCNGYGEYALVFKRSVISNYAFPEVEGEHFMGESVLYDKLELDGYTFAVIHTCLQICEYQENGLSSNAYRLLEQNPTAYQIYHMQRIDLVESLLECFRHSIQYWAFYRLSRNKCYVYHGKRKWSVYIMYLPGIIGTAYYRRKFRELEN